MKNLASVRYEVSQPHSAMRTRPDVDRYLLYGTTGIETVKIAW